MNTQMMAINSNVNQQISLTSINEPHSNKWEQAIKYTALSIFISVLAGVFTYMTDGVLVDILITMISTSFAVKYLFFTLVSIWLFLASMKRKVCKPNQRIRNESILLLATLTSAIAMIYLGFATNTTLEHLIILAIAIYAALGIWMPSKSMMTYSLLLLPVWFFINAGFIPKQLPYLFN